MNTAITKRSAAKGGRDALVMLTPATLAMTVLAERVTLSDAEYSLIFGAVTMAIGFAYRVARDHGKMRPSGETPPVMYPTGPTYAGQLGPAKGLKRHLDELKAQRDQLPPYDSGDGV